MLVILTENQLLNPQQVCQACLLANDQGQPRWHHGELGCGHAICPSRSAAPARTAEPLPPQYECAMGFRLAHIQ
ncbi:MAG: hypothetical protein ACO4AI_09655 [Prochlorothrix sp.]|nr:hypothetical protein [Prochlorothrix sp.]